MSELLGTYAVMFLLLAREPAEAPVERDGALALRDAVLGVIALRTTAPPQRGLRDPSASAAGTAVTSLCGGKRPLRTGWIGGSHGEL